MKYIEAPTEYLGTEPSLFIAGGISNCPDWQTDLKDTLADLPITLLNPRREHYFMDPSIMREQIEWEFRHLAKARAISFWFPKETLCPITLFELGKWVHSEKPLFVGVHPEYQRRDDLYIQLQLSRPEVTVTDSLSHLASQIQRWSMMRS